MKATILDQISGILAENVNLALMNKKFVTENIQGTYIVKWETKYNFEMTKFVYSYEFPKWLPVDVLYGLKQGESEIRNLNIDLKEFEGVTFLFPLFIYYAGNPGQKVKDLTRNCLKNLFVFSKKKAISPIRRGLFPGSPIEGIILPVFYFEVLPIA